MRDYPCNHGGKISIKYDIPCFHKPTLITKIHAYESAVLGRCTHLGITKSAELKTPLESPQQNLGTT